MSLNFLYDDKRGQFKTAKYYPLLIDTNKLTSVSLNPDGEKTRYQSKPINFRCGIYEGQKYFKQNLLDGLNVTGSSLSIYSSDFRAMKIKRGDKVNFENEQFIVTDFSILKQPYKNSMHQKITQNKLIVIILT